MKLRNNKMNTEVLAIKKLYIPILLVILFSLMGVSYFILRLDNLNNSIVILVTLILIIICPMNIYFFLIRPWSMPKILIYLSFFVCLGASYYIIPYSQKSFFNKIFIWLLPVMEISLILFVLYSIAKSIIRFTSTNTNENNDFLDVIRMSLEPKLGKGFLIEAVITELSVFYYSILSWFKKSKVETKGVYTYHKNSQIKMIVILFAILITGEGFLFHFLLQKWNVIAAWIFSILNLYGLLYIIGLYNSVRLLPHTIKQGKLLIRLGFQSSIETDITNIVKIKKANVMAFGEKKPKDMYISSLGIDIPQFELILKDPVLMKGSYGQKKYVNTVVFRADEPNKIIDEINCLRNPTP